MFPSEEPLTRPKRDPQQRSLLHEGWGDWSWFNSRWGSDRPGGAREICNSINATRPEFTGSTGSISHSIRPRWMASAQSSRRHGRARGREIAFVEDQIGAALGRGRCFRHRIGNTGVSDLAFRPEEPLRHRRLGHREGALAVRVRECPERKMANQNRQALQSSHRQTSARSGTLHDIRCSEHRRPLLAAEETGNATLFALGDACDRSAFAIGLRHDARLPRCQHRRARRCLRRGDRGDRRQRRIGRFGRRLDRRRRWRRNSAARRLCWPVADLLLIPPMKAVRRAVTNGASLIGLELAA